MSRDKLLELAGLLELGIENLYINDGNDDSKFLEMLEYVYNEIHKEKK